MENRARELPTLREDTLLRDEPPIIRAGIRVKIIEGERAREDETRGVKCGQEGTGGNAGYGEDERSRSLVVNKVGRKAKQVSQTLQLNSLKLLVILF